MMDGTVHLRNFTWTMAPVGASNELQAQLYGKKVNFSDQPRFMTWLPVDLMGKRGTELHEYESKMLYGVVNWFFLTSSM